MEQKHLIMTNIESKPALWAGRIIGGLTIAFLTFDSIIKIIQLPEAVKPTVAFGLSAGSVLPIGVMELSILLLYVFPRTSVLGAILLTGHLGAAIALHLRAGSDTFSLIFPVIIGAMAWGALWLRHRTLRALVPLA